MAAKKSPAKPSSVKKRFLGILPEMVENISEYVNNPGKDMTRRRCLDPEKILLFLMSLTSHRSQTEVLNFFGVNQEKLPSLSAFCQQRGKLKLSFFEEFLRKFNQKFPFEKLHKEYHLLAVDGSDINLPTDKHDFTYRVKMARSERCYYQAHLNAMFDIMENRYTDLTIQPRPEINENKAFCEMVDRNSFPANTVFVADRGYATYNNIAHVIQKGQFFLIRMKNPSARCSILRNLIDENVETDRLIHLGITRSGSKAYKEHPDQFKTLVYNTVFDPIPFSDTKQVWYTDLRCICIKLENDIYEYLLTNLPGKDFSTEEIKNLYHMRWGVETSFRSLKYALSLAYLHSIKRDFIMQEIFAKVIMYNFTSILHWYGEHCHNSRTVNKRKYKHKYKVAFDNTAAVAREFLREDISDDKIKSLLLRHTSRITTNEKHVRRIRSQTYNPTNSRP